jgi:hypothetical protein
MPPQEQQMARVLEFGGTVVVTDIEVTIPEGTFKGHAMREASYSTLWSIEVTEPLTPEGSIEADFAKQIIKATAIYEGAVYESRKKLEQAVIDARRQKLAAEQTKVEPDPA